MPQIMWINATWSTSFDAVINSEEAEHWKYAMDEEMKVLEENNTYI